MTNTTPVIYVFILDSQNDTCLIDLDELFSLDSQNHSSLSCKFGVKVSDEVKAQLLENVLINGLPFDTTKTYEVIRTNGLHMIYTLTLENPVTDNISLDCTINYGTSIGISIRIVIQKQSAEKNVLYKTSANVIDDRLASFGLIRTNPKLTGNIKLVVDTDYRIFLDTFKVSETLSDNKYRHMSVSQDGSYAADVKTIFSSLPKSELYKVPKDDLDAHKVFTDFAQQYETVYEYGAETNDDKLYSENMKILAPLWIGKNLPEFFCIFKVDSHYNEETYTTTLDDSSKFRDFLKNAEIIQTYDLRTHTQIGNYLNNYKKQIIDTTGVCYLQFIEQDVESQEEVFRQGRNSWFGISVDKGILTTKYETSYFSNKIINQTSGYQEDFDRYLVNGFERNNLVIPYIVNLEFMFNDKDSSDYSMHRYFGLYLKENDFIKYKYAVKSYANSTVYIEKFDSSMNSVDDSEKIQNILDNSDYKDRLFFGTTPNIGQRVQISDDFNAFLSDKVCNVPHENIASLKSEELNVKSSETSFITMKFSEPIRYGEHFRFIFPNKTDKKTLKRKNVVLEIIASNDSRLKGTKENIFPYVTTSQKKFDSSLNDRLKFRSTVALTNTVVAADDASLYHHTKLYVHPEETEKMSDYPVQNNIDEGFDDFADDEAGNPDNILSTSDNVDTYLETATTAGFVDAGTPTVGTLSIDSPDVPSSGQTSKIGISKYYEYSLNTNGVLLPYKLKSTLDSSTCVYQVKFVSDEFTDFPEIYRISFYTQDLTDSTKTAALSEQLKRISACIKKLNADLYVSDITENAISFMSSLTDIYFQHITADILDASLNFKDSLHYLMDFETTEQEDSIVYFSNRVHSMMHPLNFDENLYGQEMGIFSLIDFELIGWRFSNIVKFIEFNKSGKYYKLSADLSDNQKLTGTMLAQTTKGFKSLVKWPIWNYWCYVNDQYYDDAEENEMFGIQNNVNIVACPYDLKKSMVMLPYPLYTVNGMLNLFAPINGSLALMGILSMRDFDYALNNSKSEHVSSFNPMKLSTGTKLYLDYEKTPLKQYRLYKLITGAFTEYPIANGKTFYIDNDSTIHSQDIASSKISDVWFTGESLTVSKDVQIQLAESKDYMSYEYDINWPELKHSYFFTEPTDIVSSDLKEPLAVPTVCQWESNGIYFDHNSVLDLDKVKDKSYMSSLDASSGFFCSQRYTPGSFYDGQYVTVSLDDTITVGTSEMTFQDIIMSNAVEDPLRHYLVSYKKLTPAVGYYNKYVNTLEFIMYGIRFILKFTSNDYITDIRLNEYNNYEVFMVNDYSRKKDNEIYISTKEQIILVVNHNFSWKNKENKNNVFIYGSTNIENELTYTWSDFSYTLDFSKAFGIYSTTISDNRANALMAPKVWTINDSKTLDSSSYFIQYAKTTKTIRTFHPEQHNNYLYFNKEKNVYSDSSSRFGILYYFNQNPMMCLQPDISGESIYVSSVLNLNYADNMVYRSICEEPLGEVIFNRDNLLARYKESISNIFDVILLKENNEVKTIHISDSYNPLTITKSSPKCIKYNYGYFIPRAYDLLDFSIEEDSSLAALCECDFLLANTKFSSMSRLVNYVGDKVFSTSQAKKISANYFFLPERSLMSTNWDKDYYRLYSSAGSYKSLNGYVPGIEDKSFFGSKCIVLNNYDIEIKDWTYANDQNIVKIKTVNSDSNQHAKNILSMQVEINLSKAFLNYMLNKEPDFIANWQKFNMVSNTYMNNYIVNTFIKYFKISDKTAFTLYEKTFGMTNTSLSFLTSEPADFTTEGIWRKSTNVGTSYKEVNSEIILTLTIKDYQHISYYPTIKLKKF